MFMSNKNGFLSIEFNTCIITMSEDKKRFDTKKQKAVTRSLLLLIHLVSIIVVVEAFLAVNSSQI